MLQAFNTVLSRGGIKGFYQGLIPWAWIEASTKGAVLLFASGESWCRVVGGYGRWNCSGLCYDG
jgi:hypothetical protein